MKLWLDDERPAPNGWRQAFNYAEFEAILLANTKQITHVSLDHDLGSKIHTGYDAACLLERLAHQEKLRADIQVAVHSANPVGCKRMAAAIRAARISIIYNNKDPYCVWWSSDVSVQSQPW